MAELFFEDERMGMQDPIYRNKISNTPFSDLRYQDQGGVHPPLRPPNYGQGIRSIYHPMVDQPEDWRENININTLSQYPQPHLTNMRDISGEVGEYGRRPGEGFNEEMFYEAPNKGFQFPSVLGGIINAVKDQFEYRPATEEAWDPNTGEFISAEDQDRQNALGGYYSDAARNQRRQRARVINMMKRRDADKGYSEKNLQKLIDLGYGPQETITTTTVGDNINTGGGGGSEAAFTQTSPGGISQATSRAARTDQGGNVMSGWRLAEGGRIGYRNGELVDEDINVQGPGFDFNENIETASGGEEDILEQLVAKYIEAGFPPEQAQAMAMQELQQMVAQSGQGEGIASLV